MAPIFNPIRRRSPDVEPQERLEGIGLAGLEVEARLEGEGPGHDADRVAAGGNLAPEVLLGRPVDVEAEQDLLTGPKQEAGVSSSIKMGGHL